MKTFTIAIQVSKEDLDELQHVNNVRYVQWIQDVAKAHWMQLAPEDILANYFWVVTNHNIDYKASAVMEDVISITTYVKESEGVISTRVVEMYNSETDKLIVRSETKWCLMDKKTGRPTRIPQHIKDIFN